MANIGAFRGSCSCAADATRLGLLPLLAIVMCLAFPASAQTTNAVPLKYTLTIYVDESFPVGHVFVELSDGRNKLFYGHYPSEIQEDAVSKPVAALAGLGGDIIDDRHHTWDVKRSYNITKDGFDHAVRGIELARTQGQKWWLNNHCGDFAEGVANAAGVPIHLPWTVLGRDRPGVFGSYLRQHGGVIIQADNIKASSASFFQGVAGIQQISPQVQDTFAAQQEADAAAYRAELDKYRQQNDEAYRRIRAEIEAEDLIRLKNAEFKATWRDRWDYLREMTGLACSNPDALEDQMRSGRVHEVAIWDLNLAYMMDQTESNSLGEKQRPVVNSCQKYLLMRILMANGVTSGRDLLAWAGQYREEHPSLLVRFTTKIDDMFSAMGRAFIDLLPNPGNGNDDSPGSTGPQSSQGNQTDHSRHAPDVMGTRSASQLRGIASGDWN